jgi:hypothetical protein
MKTQTPALPQLLRSLHKGIVLCATPLALAGAALSGPAAFGQSDPTSARACTGIASDEARLACYDRALGSEADESAPANRSTDSRRRSTSDAGRAAADASPAEADSVRRSTRSRQPADTQDEETSVIVTVVEVRSGAPGRSIFVTDEGEVWVQSGGRRLYPPQTPFEAEVRPGALGSYFLDAEAPGFPIRIRQP